MGINMKVSSKMEKNMEMVYILGKMEIIMMDNGKMTALKDMELL
jgi:hypothetical protein